MMTSLKFLIVGRTASGKDTLREILETKYRWKFVKSYTTRKKRFEEENTHIFISKECSSEYKDKVAQTFIDNGFEEDEYFATRDEVEESDGYIIDPNGLYELCNNMKECAFYIVYLKPDTTHNQIMHFKNRISSNVMVNHIVKSRMNSEDQQFCQFDEEIKNKSLPENCIKVHEFVNTYELDKLKHLADELDLIKNLPLASKRG